MHLNNEVYLLQVDKQRDSRTDVASFMARNSDSEAAVVMGVSCGPEDNWVVS